MGNRFRVRKTLRMSRVFTFWITLVMALSMLPMIQPDPVQAQDFDEHTIIKRECPPGFDPGSGNAQNAFDNCTTLQPNSSFTLNSQDPAYQGVVRTTDIGGTTGWSDIPAASAYTIAESLPPGYGDPWVFCRIYEQLDDSGQSVEYYFQAPGGVMDVGLSDPSLIALRDATCYWFNEPPAGEEPVEEPADGPTRIIIQKRYCPFRYGVFDANLVRLQNDCATPLSNIGFTINGDPNTLQSADVNGQVIFDQVPIGSVAIREEQYASFDTARVYCVSHPDTDTEVAFNDAHEVSFTAEEGDRFLVNVEVTAGNRIDCLWFNAWITEEDLGSLIITKYICQEADDAVYASLAELTRSCPEPQAGAYFELVRGGGTSGGETDFNGDRPFLNYSPGTYDLRETAPPGYATARVFCYEHPSTEPLGIPDSFQEYTVANQSQVSVELKAGFDLDCAWINIPVAENTGWVYVHKYYCPVSTLPARASRATLLDVCDRSLIGIPFELSSPAGSYLSSKTLGQNAVAAWSDAPQDTLVLRESVPTGYEVAQVYCGTVPSYDGSPPETLAAQPYEDGVSFAMVAGSTYVCEFFNTHIFESVTGFVDVYKAACPPEFDVNAATTRDEFAVGCTDRLTGVEFDMTAPGGYSRSATSDFGTAFFQEEAPAGQLTIAETPVAGQTIARVFCGEAPYIGIGAIPEEWTDFGAATQVEFNLTPDYQLVCEWYNVLSTSEETAGSEGPQDVASPEALESVDASPVVADFGYVTIAKWVCPPTDQPGGLRDDQLGTLCSTPGEGYSYSLRNENGDEIDQTTTGPDGSATLLADAAGAYRVVEIAPDGYETRAIHCNGENAYDDTLTTETEFWTYPLTFEPGTIWDCDWYNQPLPVSAYDPGSIVIHKYTCPPGYPSESPSGQTALEFHIDGCPVPMSETSFNVEQGDETVGAGQTDANGTVVIAGVPPGSTRIGELPREGYAAPRVFCSIQLESGGGQPSAFDELTVESWGHTVELAEGDILECYWFNFPNSQGTDGAPVQIGIHKFLCPAGYEFTNQDWETFSTDCPEGEQNVSFDIVDGSGAASNGLTGTAGDLAFANLSSGFMSIAESPREGFRTLAVFCSSFTSSVPLPSLYPVENDQLTYFLAGGYTLECYWYNVESPETGNVSVFKYVCPEGYDATQSSREELSTACADPYPGIQYYLTGPENYGQERSTSQFGIAEWVEVPPGSHSMHETPADGYYPVRIFCAETPIGTPLLYEAGFTGQFVDFTAAPENILDIQLQVREGYWWWCEWFNAPVEQTGTITIVKVVCPSGYDYFEKSQDVLREDCIHKPEGVDFTLLGGGGYSQLESTDSEGRLTRDDIPPGALTIREELEFYAPVRVHCGQVPIEGPETYPTEFADYSPRDTTEWTVSIDPAYHLYCEVYNLAATGTISIYKYSCPEPFDYQTRDEFHAACTTPQSGIQFTVSAPDGYSDPEVTDANGYHGWGGVPAGPVTMTETPVEGMIPYRVFCGVTESDTVLPSAWDDVSMVSAYAAVRNLTVNTVVTCEWYNVPYEEDPPQVWIQKYNCPEDADWHWNYHQLLAECHEPGANVEYGIGPDENSLSLLVTDATGRIVLGDLDPGDLTIQENYPSGYSGFVVYCQFATPHDTGSYQKADVYNRSVKLELEDGYVVTCVFFNFLDSHEPPEVSPPSTGHPPLQPTGPSGGGTGGGGTSGGGTSGGTGGNGGTSGTGGSGNGTGGALGLPPVDPSTPANLVLTKFTCDPAYDVLAEGADATLDCTELTDEIGFSLSSIDDPAFSAQNRQTGDDGQGIVEFSSLPAGAYLVTESLPEGTIAAFISTCESDRRDFQQQNPFIPFAFAGPDGRIGVTLEPGETLECDWFDVPEEVAGGQVTVLKFACPGASVIVAQCTPWSEGATISFAPVGDEGGEPVQVTTGPDGSAVAELEGTFTVQELPDTACLVDSESFDQEGNLVVSVGDQIEVRVYNCGVQT